MRKLRMWVAIMGLIASLGVVGNGNWFGVSQDTPSQGNQSTMTVCTTIVRQQPTGSTTGGAQQTTRADDRHSRHLVVAVTDATYDKEVVQVRNETPVLIWFNRPERLCVFAEDARTMETIAKVWSGEKFMVKVVRVDTDKLKPDGRIEQEFRHVASTCKMTFTIMQDFRHSGDLHHSDRYIIGDERPLDIATDVQDMLLNFRPDCPRSQCQTCMGQSVWGRRPLAWR